MSTNPHAENAQRLLDACFQEDAKVEAALAVAYEQRTANLIAFQANVEESYARIPKARRSEQAQKLNEQIKERLELE